jgi:hypothetical protein
MLFKSLPLVLLLAAVAGPADRVPFIDAIPAATVVLAADRRELILELPPSDLPAGLTHEAMHGGYGDHGDHGQSGPGWPPVSLVTLPASGAIHGFRVELVDSAGRLLPAELLHHLNLIDPARRELFLPISRRVLAAGKETGGQGLPWFVFGLPFREGERWVLSAMLHNPTATAYSGVRTRLILEYVHGGRPWPLFDAFPWQLDVLFPVGDKSFDLPPGRSEKSYEASPAIEGSIVALGGHVHERAVRIVLTDVTTGEVIWQAAPATDETGRVTGVPVGRLYRWNRLGARVRPDHTYRVTVEYDNPTGAVVPQGGMGVIGGLIVPVSADAWPAADVSDTLYLQDLRHFLRLAPDTPVPAPGAAPHRHAH